jgi:hypothetical protein
MQFEPRLLKPDDSPMADELRADELLAEKLIGDDESGLPADLAELAGQLRADSAFLGASYRPSVAELSLAGIETVASAEEEKVSLAASSENSRTPWYSLPLAFGYLLAGLFVVTFATRFAENLFRDQPQPPVVLAPATPTEVAAEPKSPAVAWESEPDSGEESSTPAVMLRDLSGPELEGLLDLLEREPQGKPKLSI